MTGLVDHLISRRAARRYWHMTPWRSCADTMRGWCLRCMWRDVTGKNERARKAYVARIRETPPIHEPVPWRKDDDAWWAAAREAALQNHIDQSGEVPCPRPHQNLFAPGSRCHCGAQV